MCKVCICLAFALILASTVLALSVESTLVSSLDNKDPEKSETSVGSLIADAFKAQMGADMAFVSAGDLKPLDKAIAVGKVESSDVSAVLAYPDDRLVMLALDGQKVRQALERSVSNYPRPGLKFLQVAGCRMTFDPSKPEGERVTSVTVNGSPIVNEQAYKVAMPNSLANGALGYWKIWSNRNVVSKDSDSVTCNLAIDHYFRANQKLNYSVLNRVTAAK